MKFFLSWNNSYVVSGMPVPLRKNLGILSYFIVNFENISHLILVFLLLTLNKNLLVALLTWSSTGIFDYLLGLFIMIIY